jgi:thymidylate synthase (FAD)
MGDDSSIVQAARVSYGKDEQKPDHLPDLANPTDYVGEDELPAAIAYEEKRKQDKDRQLIRYLMNHSHTTPFEMVEIKFMVQVPMDCWRQWIRHRTASVNEYSTRYTEALDFFQVTDPTEWRLQATDNKQGSSGYLEEWPEEVHIQYNKNNIGYDVWYYKDGSCYSYSLPFDWWEKLGYMESPNSDESLDRNEPTPGQALTYLERQQNLGIQEMYGLRLALGIAKEQARKDLPLSTYTRAYWKCDLHNIFNFLRLRMGSHAQLEIRSYANAMFEIVKQLCPVACAAFEDYVLHAKKFSRMEMEFLRKIVSFPDRPQIVEMKPASMTDREWKAFLEKLSCPSG